MILNDPSHLQIRKGPPRPQDAIDPIASTANPHDMTDVDDIGDALTLLAYSGDAISMYAAGSRKAVLGRILSVDPELPHFVMELNEGEKLAPGSVTFVAWLRTAKLQFRLSDPAWRSAPGKPTLIPMIFPDKCEVLNRRAAERLETPLGANFRASFVLNGNPYELPLYDFSLGGVGLRCAKSEAKGLFRGRKLVDVRLELGPETVIVTELEVRLSRSYRSFLLGEQLHIGCKFIDLRPEMESEIAALLAKMNNAPRRC
ncbi:flagellar brake protein [Pseudoduganella namucuonensis]|uniref:C-di-GMP-binding flagellar brake protein YcgR, contains PilZNR and PilZ domains n=1 Tax=Pseudoduganella namucuonensis TaxID=1035707 RepID=A0A1I7LZM7_9BURK|nr:PilZ domain-containing protein [Pseudoduganella namucuonensis]SFV15164.1 c-di-GMP-binding flagellar brake protein YcgR, contains PilZNR and PilZ domains [Pseudoduganella namucuonensis]